MSNVLNTKVSNLKKIFLKQEKKKPEIIPVPFVCICTILLVGLV